MHRTFYPIRFGRYSPYGAFAEQSDSPAVQAVVRMREDRERRAVELADQDGRAVVAAAELRTEFQIPDYYANQVTAIVTWVWRGDYPNKAGEAVQRLVELRHIPHAERARAETIVNGAMKERGTCKA